MATLPSSNTAINAAATALAKGTEYVCIVAPVASNADGVPRLYGQATAIQTQHGYCAGVEHAARHIAETGKPVVFIGVSIATPGAVGREDTSGNTGTSVTTLAAGGDGVLQEHDGSVWVITGGTIGTDQILLGYSLDGERTTRRYKLGTGSSLVLPDVNVTMSFAAGTLVTGDTIHTWHGSEPRSDATGWATAFDTLAAQQKYFRSMILIGELQNLTEAGALRDELNTYKSTVKRAVFGRASVPDRLPLAEMSSTTHRATGTFTVTLGDDDPDTITRSAGSFVSDGFAAGDIVTIDGTTSNDGTLATAIDTVGALVLTCDATETLTAEGPVSGVSIVGEASLTFSDAADTITRAGGNPGSWVDDGFYVGASVTIAGTVGNDQTTTVVSVTDLVLEVTAAALSDEVIGITAATITAGQTKAVWMAARDAAFESITGTGASGAARLDLGAGRGRKTSPLTGWYYRVPVSEADSIRSFQNDLHIAPWRYDDGPTGYDLFDEDGNLVEWDDRVDGGAGCAANFTTFRTWANDGGAYIALSLTRAGDGSRLQYSHNQAVVDLIDNTAQRASLTAVGQSLVLKTDGTITNASARRIEKSVNDSLSQAIADRGLGDGQRASRCVFTLSRTDVLNVDPATLTYVVELDLNGTVHTINGEIQVK